MSMSDSPGSERTACQEGMCRESSEPLAGRLGAPAQRSVADLEAAIKDYLEHHNADPRPFIWTAPAADILESRQRETSVRVGALAGRAACLPARGSWRRFR